MALVLPKKSAPNAITVPVAVPNMNLLRNTEGAANQPHGERQRNAGHISKPSLQYNSQTKPETIQLKIHGELISDEMDLESR